MEFSPSFSISTSELNSQVAERQCPWLAGQGTEAQGWQSADLHYCLTQPVAQPHPWCKLI